jgi:hypothetical protein
MIADLAEAAIKGALEADGIQWANGCASWVVSDLDGQGRVLV